MHISHGDVEKLFGRGYTLTPAHELGQPGEFLCKERARLVGPKGQLVNVAILGPVREKTQVEISLTDARTLGVNAPVRVSGNHDGAGDVVIFAGQGFLAAGGVVIAAKNHIHMTPQDASAFGLLDGECVRVRVRGGRTVTFDDVTVRVSGDFALALHLDTDEAGACALTRGMTGEILSPCKCEKHGAVTRGIPAGTAQTLTVPDKLITEEVAKKLAASGTKSLTLAKGAIITPLARDIFRSAGIEVCREGEKI